MQEAGAAVIPVTVDRGNRMVGVRQGASRVVQLPFPDHGQALQRQPARDDAGVRFMIPEVEQLLRLSGQTIVACQGGCGASTYRRIAFVLECEAVAAGGGLRPPPPVP